MDVGKYAYVIYLLIQYRSNPWDRTHMTHPMEPNSEDFGSVPHFIGPNPEDLKSVPCPMGPNVQDLSLELCQVKTTYYRRGLKN